MRLINTANYDIKTLQARLVPILECIDKVCREHHLRYYLWAGTMLGAVRHKGFIPWDDDMDICMPRPDYDLLLAHCQEWMPAPFEVVGPHNRADYPYPFAKVEDASTTVLERPDFNFPEGTRLMENDKPYLELVVGVHNIFRFFQVAYVRRLTYTDLPGVKKNGVRFGFQFTF